MENEVINFQIRPVPYDPWDITQPIITFSSTKEEAAEMLKTYELMTGKELMITITHK